LIRGQEIPKGPVTFQLIVIRIAGIEMIYGQIDVRREILIHLTARDTPITFMPAL
jgi:hypothetical protein